MFYIKAIAIAILVYFLIDFIMPKFIEYLKNVGYHQVVSDYSLKEYQEKAKTPTMGGTTFVVVPIVVFLLINILDLKDPKIWILVYSFFSYGLIGFIDDYIIVIKNNNDGLLPKYKLLFQLIAVLLFIFFYLTLSETWIIIPFLDIKLDLGILYGIFIVIMFTAETNAVNFTDGMDGLAAGVSFIAFLPYLLYAYYQKEFGVALFLVAVLSGLLAYFKYNRHPAKIFMGDAGALALGGLIAAVAMVLKVELSLLIIGGVFLWEMLCVVIQQLAVRILHRRVFIYTPIHYAFVKKGMNEVEVVRMFYVIQLICSILGILLLFLS